MAVKSTTAKSSVDAGMGLIYRLNTLFNKVEDAAMAGDFDRWDFVLDRLFVNLTYKGVMSYVLENDINNQAVKVIDVDIPLDEKLVYDKFRALLRNIKTKTMNAIRAKDRKLYNELREQHYKILITKDIWLRKLMMEKGLYLKEFEFDPTKALWGG